MERLTCWNSAGQLLEQMYQWDDNRILKIKGGALEANTSYEIHMNNKRMAKSFVLVPEIDDYFFIVEVPAALLETPDTIAVYLYAENDLTHEMRVVGTAHIKVIPRAKPADYVSEPTDGLRMVADGLVLQGGKVYLTNGGVPFGDGADIGESGGSSSTTITLVANIAATGDVQSIDIFYPHFSCDPEYYFDSQVTCTVSGRQYQKADGNYPAIGMIINTNGYSFPLFISTVESAVLFHAGSNWCQLAGFTVVHDGLTWYYSNVGPAMGGTYNDSEGHLLTYSGTVNYDSANVCVTPETVLEILQAVHAQKED